MDNNNDENKKPLKSIEMEGKDIGDAIQKGLKFLDVERKDVNIEILSEEDKGLFGMQGAKPAKVKISLKNK